jgi:hypothetical protein
MAEMGRFFHGFVQRSFPGIDLQPLPGDWKDCLPQLHPGLQKILADNPH